jgi:hypothetical protein
MHRGRLVVWVLSAACLVGCDWFAGIEDLSLAPDEGGLTRREGGNDDSDEYSSADAEKEGSDGDGEPESESPAESAAASGTPVAASWTDLTKNGPTHAIDLTETRASLATASIDGSKTWTATLTTGVLGTPSCSNFASNASVVEGEVGHCTGTGTVNWTSAYTTETCDITNHLYCFEQ